MTFPDVLLLAGSAAFTAGVHLLFGAGWALIVIGSGSIYAAAKLYRRP